MYGTIELDLEEYEMYLILQQELGTDNRRIDAA